MGSDLSAKLGAGRQVLILPTTSQALHLCSLLSNLGLVDLTVGRSDVLPVHAPAQALGRVERLTPNQGFSIVVFGDQLVSAVDAPISVRISSSYQFHSCFEYVLNQLHGFSLRFSVAGKRSIDFSSCSPDEEIFSAYAEYLAGCEALGSSWLARSTQQERTPEFRRRQQRIRVQALRSSLLHMTTIGKHTWDASYGEILQLLERVYASGRR